MNAKYYGESPLVKIIPIIIRMQLLEEINDHRRNQKNKSSSGKMR